MDKLEDVEMGDSLNVQVHMKVFLRRFSPATRLLLRRIALLWGVTVVGTAIAVTLPWSFFLLSIIGVYGQEALSTGLWFVLLIGGYVVCAFVFEEDDKQMREKYGSYLRRTL